MIRGSLITFAFQIVAIIMGFATRSFLAAILHADGLGLFEIFRFIPTFLHAASNLGLNNSIINFLGKKKYTAKELTAVSITGCLVISVVSLIIAAIAFTGVRFAFWGTDLIELANVYIVLGVVMYIPYMLWFMNTAIHLGRNRIVEYNIVWILQPLVLFIGIILVKLFVPGDADVSVKSSWAYISYSAGIFASLGYGYYVLVRDKIFAFNYPRGALRENIKFGIKTHIGSFVGFLGLRINIPFLAITLSSHEVGIYSVAYAFGEAFKRIFSSISTALLPVAASAEGERARGLINVVLRNTIFICVVTLCIFAIFAKLIVYYLFVVNDPDFVEAYNPTLLVLVWVFFSSLNKVFQSDAIGRSRPIWVTYSMLVTFVVLITASWYLVPVRGVMGAAWASTLSSIAGFVVWMGLYITKAEGFSLMQALIVKPVDLVKVYRNLFGKTNDGNLPPTD